MKVLMVGGGGREHALARKILESPDVSKVYVAPGNAGTEWSGEIGGLEKCMKNVPIGAEEVDKLVSFAYTNADLVVVGPEAPLMMGIVDAGAREGVYISGCSAEAAMLEGSKVFAKDLMKKYGIPTARFKIADTSDKAIEHAKCILKKGKGVVIKADGLAAGKGVIVCDDDNGAMSAIQRIMGEKEFGDAGKRAVVEERLYGEEVSFIAFTDGKTVMPLASSQDHKRQLDNDMGPNTGGMGAYSPAPVVTDRLHGVIMDRIMLPTVKAMSSEGKPFKGFLYAGIMVVDGEPYALEFNARMGDPEAQPIMIRMKSDIVPYLKACIDGDLHNMPPIEWHPDPAVCVVMVAGGYPGKYPKDMAISGLEEAAKMDGVFVYHAGTARKNGKIVTSGGRVLGVTARAPDVRSAIDLAYLAVGKISFGDGFGPEPGKMYFRHDIGKGAFRER